MSNRNLVWEPIANTTWVVITNAFCPTGEGGGQDNSCSSSGGTDDDADEIDFSSPGDARSLYLDVPDPEHWSHQGKAWVDEGVEIELNPSLEGLKVWSRRGPVKIMPLGKQLIAWDNEDVHHVPVARALGYGKKVPEDDRLTVRRMEGEILVEDNAGNQETLDEFFSRR